MSSQKGVWSKTGAWKRSVLPTGQVAVTTGPAKGARQPSKQTSPQLLGPILLYDLYDIEVF